jgi:phosphoketolase
LVASFFANGVGTMGRDQTESIVASALSAAERALIDAYWRAANYLSVGQIYLYDNPLLKQPLTKDTSSRDS